MPVKIYVTKVSTCETCETCNGSGIVQNPLWTDYWEWYDAFTVKHGHNPTNPEIDSYIQAHHMEHEPEEMTCPECEGAGEFEDRIELKDALELIMGH